MPFIRAMPSIRAMPFIRAMLFVYKSPSHNNQFFCNFLSELLDCYSSICDNKAAFGDFSLEMSHPVMLPFINNENFFNLLKGNTVLVLT